MHKKEWIQEYIRSHIARTSAMTRINLYKNHVPFFGKDTIQYIYIVYDPNINRSEGKQIKSFCNEIDVEITCPLPLHCPDTLHILMLFFNMDITCTLVF